jgi:hypothetical protein
MSDVEDYEGMCPACKAGFPDEGPCDESDYLPPCPWQTGRFITLHEYRMAIVRADIADEAAGIYTEPTDSIGTIVIPKTKGDSGYIDPAAWPSTENIGGFVDPESTGRKRVKKMFPIPAGTACEWAGLAKAGGGIYPIIGCLNNPATDWHHGPDKNTLNNTKMSRGVGAHSENVHIICSFCHNAWHAANDPTYPPYDRVLDQAKSWYPEDTDKIQFHDAVTQATTEQLLEIERARRAGYDKKGVVRHGRAPRTIITDTEIMDESDD